MKPTVFGKKTDGISSTPSVFKSQKIEEPKTPIPLEVKPSVFGNKIPTVKIPSEFESHELKDILTRKWNSNPNISSCILTLFDEDIKQYNSLISSVQKIGNQTDFIFLDSRVKQIVLTILETINSKWKSASSKKETINSNSQELELCETKISKEISNILLKKNELLSYITTIQSLKLEISSDITFFEYLEKDEKFENIALSKKMSFSKTLVGLEELEEMVNNWNKSFDEMVLIWNNLQTNINQLQLLILQTKFDNLTETDKYSFRSLIQAFNF